MWHGPVSHHHQAGRRPCGAGPRWRARPSCSRGGDLQGMVPTVTLHGKERLSPASYACVITANLQGLAGVRVHGQSRVRVNVQRPWGAPAVYVLVHSRCVDSARESRSRQGCSPKVCVSALPSHRRCAGARKGRTAAKSASSFGRGLSLLHPVGCQNGVMWSELRVRLRC